MKNKSLIMTISDDYRTLEIIQPDGNQHQLEEQFELWYMGFLVYAGKIVDIALSKAKIRAAAIKLVNDRRIIIDGQGREDGDIEVMIEVL